MASNPSKESTYSIQYLYTYYLGTKKEFVYNIKYKKIQNSTGFFGESQLFPKGT